MKKISFTLLVMTCIVIALPAQVKQEDHAMVAGSKPALTVFLEGVDNKYAELEWKDYMKSYGKVIKVKNAKESVVEDIHIGDVGGGNLLDVYSLAELATGGTKMFVWIDMQGDFLTSSAKEYPTAERFLLDFAHKVKVDQVTMDLENQQKKLEKLEGVFTKLQKENDNLHKLISDSKLKIEQAEADLEANEKEQEVAQAKVRDQKARTDTIQNNPDELKVQLKELSKAESNYSKLVRENESLHKVITDSNAKIKQAEIDIVANLEAQESAQTDINNQKIVLETVQKKLDKIKSEKPK